MKMSAVVAGTALVGLAGCAEIHKAEDWATNKILTDRNQVGQLQPEPWSTGATVPAQVQCRPFTPAFPESDNCCQMERYTSALDIETAAARSRVEYNFQQKKPPNEGHAYSGYKGHAFEAMPGSFYRMFGEVVPRSDVRLSRGVYMRLVLSKASTTTTLVEPLYCEIRGRTMKDQMTWHQAVQASIVSTLPPSTTNR